MRRKQFWKNAQINMTDTSVSAPFSGRIDTTALEVGNYVTAGQTTLAKNQQH